MNKYLTEFIGTFFLVLIIGLSVVSESPLAPVAIGCGLIALVYMGGHISGAHYNPAVTLGLALNQKCKWLDVIPYWIAQMLGSGIAALIVSRILLLKFEVKPGVDYLAGNGLWCALGIEVLFAFLLMLVIFNVATAKGTTGNPYYGAAIGLTVLAGAVAGGGISGGAFNPAVGIGSWVVHEIVNPNRDYSYVWIYLLGPILGAVLAAIIFRLQNPGDFAK